MSEFTNVTVVREANVYFDGKVSSRTIKFADGTTKSLGFMLPGRYEFGTETAEVMEILSGSLEVLLPESEDWLKVAGGESFNVPANAKFTVQVTKPTDYCCSYID